MTSCAFDCLAAVVGHKFTSPCRANAAARLASHRHLCQSAPVPPDVPPGMAPTGMAPPGMVLHGMVPPGMAPPGMAQHGMALPGMAPPGMAQRGMVPPGMAQRGMVPPGMAQPGMAQPAFRPALSSHICGTAFTGSMSSIASGGRQAEPLEQAMASLRNQQGSNSDV